MFGWWKRRKAYAALVEADATDLMARYGHLAYHEAKQRNFANSKQTLIDGNRPDRHWFRVRRVIEKREGHDGLDTATRYDVDRMKAAALTKRLNRQARHRKPE